MKFYSWHFSIKVPASSDLPHSLLSHLFSGESYQWDRSTFANGWQRSDGERNLPFSIKISVSICGFHLNCYACTLVIRILH
ncbi:hypothetical protein Vspart_01569 [Vibrio spartinae]|uniref:Uncharacterized protein n=1 Tax=Vibrio spartinae TaxID=1918945 RepID=A0A1N6M6R0_9VIBR|nr:hypothetical protein Vspart_01569 [Vibrio spartinae]SIO95125.1 hypothetical protein VSP9026_02864 [Vibrio spartinae]